MSTIFKLKQYLKTSLTPEQKNNFKELQALKFRALQGFIYQIFWGSNLKVLASIYNSDKWGVHWYAQHYEKHLAHLRYKKLNILEIGVGGYDNPKAGGCSLRMWRTYFPRSRIFGIDIYDKTPHNERRIKTFQGSQVDEVFLENVLKEIGTIDIIIDDGSHLNEHIIHTFKFLFPRLSENGIYVIEDIQTSYWPSFGGSSENLNSSDTAMGFLKQLIDGLNYVEYKLENYKPNYFDRHITAMYFYHNLVFIQKGLNNENSNINR